MSEIEVILPYPPSVNTYWRMWKNRMLISKRGREYRKEVCATLAMSRSKRFSGKPRLMVHVRMYAPDKRRRDVDNISKAILDSITHAGIWDDDSQVDDLRISRREVTKGGMVKVKISEMTDDS